MVAAAAGVAGHAVPCAGGPVEGGRRRGFEGGARVGVGGVGGEPRGGGGATSVHRVGAFYTAAAYDRALAGGLVKLAFSADIKGRSSGCAFVSLGQSRAALVQDGGTSTGIGAG